MPKKILTDDGTDVTETVKILYDVVHGSMDWGSGFLDNEEMEAVVRFAILMDMQVPDLPASSPAIQTVALKFPEHYEVTQKVTPAHTDSWSGRTIPERVYYTVKAKKRDDEKPTA